MDWTGSHPLSQWLFSALAEAGLPAICVETRHTRAVLKAQIDGADRNDARGIAQMTRVGLCRPVHVGRRSKTKYKSECLCGRILAALSMFSNSVWSDTTRGAVSSVCDASSLFEKCTLAFDKIWSALLLSQPSGRTVLQVLCASTQRRTMSTRQYFGVSLFAACLPSSNATGSKDF